MASVFKRGGKKNRGGNYYIDWIDDLGNRCTKSSRTTDKATAERIASKLESEAALRREGVVDASLDSISKESKRRIESHLTDYKAKLQAASRSTDHIHRTVGFVQRISNWASFNLASDITSDGVNRYAAKLKEEGRSARTIQAHLTAIKE